MFPPLSSVFDSPRPHGSTNRLDAEAISPLTDKDVGFWSMQPMEIKDLLRLASGYQLIGKILSASGHIIRVSFQLFMLLYIQRELTKTRYGYIWVGLFCNTTA